MFRHWFYCRLDFPVSDAFIELADYLFYAHRAQRYFCIQGNVIIGQKCMLLLLLYILRMFAFVIIGSFCGVS